MNPIQNRISSLFRNLEAFVENATPRRAIQRRIRKYVREKRSQFWILKSIDAQTKRQMWPAVRQNLNLIIINEYKMLRNSIVIGGL
jgi:hypothetical protein